MVGFFRNTFQQTGFTPTEEFKTQLLQNGGFDFGPSAERRRRRRVRPPGAEHAGQLRAHGLAAHRGGPAVHRDADDEQIHDDHRAQEPLHPDRDAADAPFGNDERDARLDDGLQRQPRSRSTTLIRPVPTTCVRRRRRRRQRTGFGRRRMPRRARSATVRHIHGTSLLFQRLLGFTPRYPVLGQPDLLRARVASPTSRPTTSRDWNGSRSTTRPTRRSTPVISPTTCPTLRNATELTLSLPRVGFYTTPAFLALWNTNDSNQHRVTANQTLLVGARAGVHQPTRIVPLSQRRASTRRTRSPARSARLPQEPRSDAPVLGEPAGLQRPQRLPGGSEVHGRGGQPAARDASAAASPSATSTPPAPDIAGIGPLLLQVVTPTATAVTGSRSRSRRSSASSPTRRRAARATPSSGGSSRAFENSSNLQLRRADQGVLRVAAGDRRGGDRDVHDRQLGAGQHRAARPLLRGAVEPAGQARHLRAGGAAAVQPTQTATAKIAAGVAADAFSRGAQSP